ncbi:hypothetical protein Goari_009009 [Gossypium aridum]|uniref:Aspergillus nuclease S1 n=1 Tax=Gossypium aridum TaxID=34290 RepID=A0A7J8XWE3_GOSAI|nr:hypothetical protein [Gossypium aridum]
MLIGDCHDTAGHKDHCVTGAIFNYTKQLFSAYQGYSPQLSYNLTEALMFLAHFIGDVHQLLTFMWKYGRKFVNLFLVKKEFTFSNLTFSFLTTAITCWLLRRFRWEYNYSPLVPQEDKSTPCELFSVQHPFLVFPFYPILSLFQVWDTMIIDSAVKTLYGSDLATMIQAIQRNITDAWSNDVSSWKNCGHNQTVCPNVYASESVRMACKFAYRNATPGSTLEDEYFLSRLPIVEKRLAQGGIRLAAVLNRLFNSEVKIAQA